MVELPNRSQQNIVADLMGLPVVTSDKTFTPITLEIKLCTIVQSCNRVVPYLNPDITEPPLVLAEELLETGELLAAGRQAPAVVFVHLEHGPEKQEKQRVLTR